MTPGKRSKAENIQTGFNQGFQPVSPYTHILGTEGKLRSYGLLDYLFLGVLKHKADFLPDSSSGPVYILSAIQNPAFRRPDETVCMAHEQGFSGSVGSCKDQEFSGKELKIYPSQSPEAVGEAVSQILKTKNRFTH